jgi:hypothetical protein
MGEIIQEGVGAGAKYFEETVTGPALDSEVTMTGKVVSAKDLDNVVIELSNGRCVTVPARSIEGCLVRKEVSLPARADEVVAAPVAVPAPVPVTTEAP